MAKIIGVDSLAFISITGLYRAMGLAGRNTDDPRFCDACFTGDYPTRLTDLEGPPPVRQLSLLAEAS
jgi:amidophosphoribosyltransferase